MLNCTMLVSHVLSVIIVRDLRSAPAFRKALRPKTHLLSQLYDTNHTMHDLH